MQTKICTKCGRELPLDQFNWRNKAAGTRRADCKECHNGYVKQQYQKRKQIVQELKSNCSCAKCGDTRGYVLDYHHIDPNVKDATVARLTSNSTKIETALAEIEKCIVLCANCHREFHYLQQQNSDLTIEEYLG